MQAKIPSKVHAQLPVQNTPRKSRLRMAYMVSDNINLCRLLSWTFALRTARDLVFKLKGLFLKRISQPY